MNEKEYLTNELTPFECQVELKKLLDHTFWKIHKTIKSHEESKIKELIKPETVLNSITAEILSFDLITEQIMTKYNMNNEFEKDE